MTGAHEWIAANNRAIKALSKGDFTEAVAKKTKNRAKYRGPRKTGKLIKGIDYVMEGPDGFKITCNVTNEEGVDYPSILEYGLSRYIPIGSAKSPRIIISGNSKTAFLPFIQWAAHRTVMESEKIFKKEVLKFYR